MFWEPLGNPRRTSSGCLVVGILAALNVIGVKESAGLNIFLALTDFVTQVALVVLGVVLVLDPETLVQNVDFGTAPTVSDFLIAIPVGMVAYTGIETISNMAEEARDHATTIPRAMAGVVAAVFAIYAFLPAVALSAMPVENGRRCTPCPRRRADTRTTIRRRGEPRPRPQGAARSVGVLAATILFIATNAGMIGVSRLTYSMGQHRQLPERLRALHLSVRHTSRSWCSGCVACLTILPGKADFLGTIYAFGAMLSFTIAHLAVIALRSSSPSASGLTEARARCVSSDESCLCSQSWEGSARRRPGWL